MAATNYYLGLKRGDSNNPGNVTIGTSSSGTAADVEVRIQINDGVNATNITGKDVVLDLENIVRFVIQRGITGTNFGVDLPAN